MKLSNNSKLDTQTNIETNLSLKCEENYKLFQKKERVYLNVPEIGTCKIEITYHAMQLIDYLIFVNIDIKFSGSLHKNKGEINNSQIVIKRISEIS